MAPTHARPGHHIETRRLILRTGVPSDAKQFSIVRIDPANNPFGGVVGADRPESEQAKKLLSQQESAARGENGFMVIILKADQTAPDSASVLQVHDGWLIGMSGYNSFPLKAIDGVEGYVGDIGALVDHRFARKGYAIEALEGLIEHGFEEMELSGILIETNADNEPWKDLMEAMELHDAQEFCSDDGGSFIYKFGKQKWDAVKPRLVEKGKWLL